MSKPRFKLYATFDTAAHGLTVKNNLASQLAGKDIFEEHSFTGFLDPENGNAPTLIGEWRFNNSVDRDAVRDWIQDQIQNHPQVKVWTQTAKVVWHQCSHDDSNVQSCKTTNYSSWSKGDL